MERRLRWVAGVSAAALAISFFLPGDFFNSPRERARWAVDAAGAARGGWEQAAFGSVALAIVYPYVAALIALGGLAVGGGGAGARRAARVQAVWHAIGGGAIAFVGAILLVSRDTWFPIWTQVACVAVPLALVGGICVALLRVRAGGELAAVTALGFLPQVFIQFGIALALRRECLPAWGFGLGGGAALAGCAACVAALAAGRARTSGGAGRCRSSR